MGNAGCGSLSAMMPTTFEGGDTFQSLNWAPVEHMHVLSLAGMGVH